MHRKDGRRRVDRRRRRRSRPMDQCRHRLAARCRRSRADRAGREPDFDDLIETSTSLGEAITEGDELTLHSLSRSGRTTPRFRGRHRHPRRSPRLAGGTLEVKSNYGGWRPNLSSRALASAAHCTSAASEQLRWPTAVHAGLETAVIGTEVPGLDMLSFGPRDRVSAFARRAGEHPYGGALLAVAGRGRRELSAPGKT